MRCEDAVLDIGPLLSGDLTSEAERRVLDHLASCPACMAEMERLRDVWLSLGELAVEPPDSDRMRERFLTSIEAYRTGVEARPHAPALAPISAEAPRVDGASRATGASGWLPWVGGVAAALVMGVLLGRESMGRPADTASQLVALQRELHDTREMVTLALLRQPSASERLRGVNWTERIVEPGVDVVAALLDALTHDPNVNVRLAAVDALARYAERPGVRTGAVTALRESASAPLVQVALIDLLVQLREPASKDTLQHLAADGSADAAVRGRAAWALEQLKAL